MHCSALRAPALTYNARPSLSTPRRVQTTPSAALGRGLARGVRAIQSRQSRMLLAAARRDASIGWGTVHKPSRKGHAPTRAAADESATGVAVSTEPTLIEPRLISFYSGFFAYIGIRTPLLPVWLQQVKGLGSTQIGLVLSCMQFAAVVTVPLMAFLADSIGKPRTVIIALGLTVTAIYTTMIFTHTAMSLPVMAVCMVVGSMLLSATLPIGESIAQAVLGEGSPIYGRVRLWGSVAFMVASTLVGQAVAIYGNHVILWALAGTAAFTAVAAMLQPSMPATTKPESSNNGTGAQAGKSGGAGDVLKLLTNKPFLLAVLCGGCLQASHAMYYAFGTLSFAAQGYSGGVIGLLWSVGVCAEIVLFAATSALKKPVSPPLLTALGGAAGVLRWGIMGTFTELPFYALMTTQLLHGCTFAAVHLGTVGFLGIATPPTLRSSAQAIYTALSDGGFMCMATMMAAKLYSAYNNQAFLFSMMMSAAGTVGALTLHRVWDGKKVQLQ